MKFSASVTIDAPIERVWETLTDETRLPLWSAGYPLLSYPEGARRADPTGQQFVLSFPNVGPPREVHGEYVLFSAPDRLVVRCRDGEKMSLVTYALRSEGQRTTMLVTSETSEYRSAVLQFFGRLLGPLYRAMFRSSLSRLKRLVERA
jgi:uncharacterized protein YndB with AHSA1/START domain